MAQSPVGKFVSNRGGAAVAFQRGKKPFANVDSPDIYREAINDDRELRRQGATSATAATANEKKFPEYRANETVNVLNSYRSYTPIFTLAALKKTALRDVTTYRNSSDYYVIAKSGGKGITGLSVPATPADDRSSDGVPGAGRNNASTKIADDLANKATLVDQFNKESPGRFDFYLNNVIVETIMGGSQKTGMSIATKIEFDVIEPYSMTGFIEALQVSAVAAGHRQYASTPYLLKMEFLGHPDNRETSSDAEIIPDSTRYFIFSFTSLDVDVNEEGTRYRCKGVPLNEKGFAEPAVLKTSLTIAGNDVETVLRKLVEEVQKSKESDAKAQIGPGSSSNIKCDRYSIEFVDLGDSDSKTITKIKKSPLSDKLRSKAVYQCAPHTNERQSSQYVPEEQVLAFGEGSTINDIIVSVIRDSDYVKNLIKDIENNQGIDSRGMVKYFMVHMEVELLEEYSTTTNKPLYHYRYVVSPYEIHYTRIPGYRKDTVDTTRLKKTINRQYNYIYTGKNVDIRAFQLKFNTLYYQAIPASLGNQKDAPASAYGVQSSGLDKKSPVSSRTGLDVSSPIGLAEERVDISNSAVQPGNSPSGGQRQVDPYDALAKNMHQAILNNVDQFQIEIDILGDPYFLVTGMVGNYRPSLRNIGITDDGEAAYFIGDVIVGITFRNPVDIDTISGNAIFDQRVALYSGLFRVLNVITTIKDGVFLQKLQALKLPNQIEETNLKPLSTGVLPASSTSEDASQAPIQLPDPSSNLARATPSALAESILGGTPITGGPGALSNLVSDFRVSTFGNSNSINSLINLADSSGVIGKSYQNIGSLIRLSASGLSKLSSSVNEAGGSIIELTKTAFSAGISNAKNLVKTTQASLLDANADISDSEISKVASIGQSSAGLSSGIFSKIENLSNTDDLLSSQLGMNVRATAGLGGTFQTRLSEKIQEAAQSIPAAVDINSAVANGLIMDNIPSSAMANIPATQPRLTAPAARLNLSDIQAVIDRGGSLSTVPGASMIAGLSNLTYGLAVPSVASGLDNTNIASKLRTVDFGLQQITGQAGSVESSLNRVMSVVPGGLPTVASVGLSATTKFGSKATQAQSPLDLLLKNKA